MGNPFRKLDDWLRYERLHHYPALSTFDRASALKRLEHYEREERDACRPWINGMLLVGAAAWLAWMVTFWTRPDLRIASSLASFGLYAAGWTFQYAMHRRIRRRVEAKVAAERRDGRLWTCYECGYDLRESAERCPECGTPVRVVPPA